MPQRLRHRMFAPNKVLDFQKNVLYYECRFMKHAPALEQTGQRRDAPRIHKGRHTMFDSNSDLTPFQAPLPLFGDSQSSEDKRPLPLIVADGNPDLENGWPAFPLAYHEIDGEYYYAVQDWIRGVLQISDPKKASDEWYDIKRRFKSAKIQSPVFFGTLKSLNYRATDGKIYKRDHAQAAGLYEITERMNVNKALENRILGYLAVSGAVVDKKRIEAIEAREAQKMPPMEDAALKDFEVAFKELVATYQKLYRRMGKSDNWINVRVQSAIQRKKFTDAFQKALRERPSQFQFAEITDTMRVGLWKRDTKALRIQMGLPSNATLRDHQSEIALTYEMLTEQFCEFDLQQEKNLEYAQAQAIVRNDAQKVGKHAEEMGRERGIDIATGKPLLSAKTGKPKTKPAQS